MSSTIGQVHTGRLEQSCEPGIRLGACVDGIEFADAAFVGPAFAPHRHDCYAIGVTIAGIQSFRYRGARRDCRPGQFHVLHPDEVHDGRAGDDQGFRYRMLYLAPALVQEAVGGRLLPFVADPVHQPDSAFAPLAPVLNEIDEPIDDLRREAIATLASDALLRAAGCGASGRLKVDLAAVSDVREYLAAHANEPTPAATLERISGHDRWSLARQFRAAFGTSPDRYRTLRRLDRARTLIATGTPLAEAAAQAGFADQSHMARQFKRTFGLTPGRYAAVITPPPGSAATIHSPA